MSEGRQGQPKFDDAYPTATATRLGCVRIGSGLTMTDGVLSSPGASGGTVTTISVATANGFSGTVANPTSTPAITIIAGAITPTSVASSGTVAGSNLSGTNTGDQTITLTGAVTGSGTGSFATTVVTNANLTGPVTSSGNVTTITNAAVTYAKIQDVSATDKLLGRSTSGAGVVEEIACTPFARTILDDADAATVRATIGAGTGSGTVSTASVASANGFAGTVADATTTPVITLSTAVNGILLGNGTAVSAASTVGSGAVVLRSNAALITPDIGVASATSLNGLTITAGSGTLTIANGKTLTVSNTLTFTGTDGNSFAFPSGSDTVVTLAAAQTLASKTLGSGTKTAVGSDATGDMYYRASDGTFTRIPLGTVGQSLVAGSTVPAWGTASATGLVKVINSSRTSAAGSGTQTISGVGFTPKLIEITASTGDQSNDFSMTDGSYDGTTQGCAGIGVRNNGGAATMTHTSSSTQIIFLDQSDAGGTKTYAAIAGNIGSDGFDLVWTKTGAATQNVVFKITFWQ